MTYKQKQTSFKTNPFHMQNQSSFFAEYQNIRSLHLNQQKRRIAQKFQGFNSTSLKFSTLQQKYHITRQANWIY